MYGKQIRLMITAIAVIAFACGTVAQDYAIDWHTTDGGGGSSAGGSYELLGTIGQSDAGVATGGTYELLGGFHFSGGGDVSIDPPGFGDDVCSGGSNGDNPCSSDSDCPGGTCGNKNRYVTVTPVVLAVAGGDALSVQVTIVDIDDALGFDAVEGEVWWAGPSQQIDNTPNAALDGAELLCEPTPSTAAKFSGGAVHLFGAPIVPGSTYEVRMCDDAGNNCSDPLTVSTSKWGDVVAGFGGGSQPDFGDITALVDKFKQLGGAKDMTRTDLRGGAGPGSPNTPDHVTNFSDISADVDAFKGFTYPFTIPTCP